MELLKEDSIIYKEGLINIIRVLMRLYCYEDLVTSSWTSAIVNLLFEEDIITVKRFLAFTTDLPFSKKDLEKIRNSRITKTKTITWLSHENRDFIKNNGFIKPVQDSKAYIFLSYIECVLSDIRTYLQGVSLNRIVDMSEIQQNHFDSAKQLI